MGDRIESESFECYYCGRHAVPVAVKSDEHRQNLRSFALICERCLDKHAKNYNEYRANITKDYRDDLLQMTMRKYTNSSHWRIVRRAVALRFEGKCALCGEGEGVRLAVHHRSYENLGAERLADLTLLCHSCHGIFHGCTKWGPFPATLTGYDDLTAASIVAELQKVTGPCEELQLQGIPLYPVTVTQPGGRRG